MVFSPIIRQIFGLGSKGLVPTVKWRIKGRALPWGGFWQQTELCTSKFWYLDSTLAGGVCWPSLSPKHVVSSWGRSHRGVALPLLCQHFHHEGEVGWGAINFTTSTKSNAVFIYLFIPSLFISDLSVYLFIHSFFFSYLMYLFIYSSCCNLFFFGHWVNFRPKIFT